MDDPLIQYARRSWFIRTTQEIGRVKENNQNVHWEPDHIKNGRMGQFLGGNVDWALSRVSASGGRLFRFGRTTRPVQMEADRLGCANPRAQPRRLRAFR